MGNERHRCHGGGLREFKLIHYPTGGYIGGLRRRFRAAGPKTSADELNPMPPTPYAPPSQNPHFPRNRSHASPAFFPRRNPLQANHFQPAPPNRHTVSAHPPR